MDHRVRKTIEFLEAAGYRSVSVDRLATRVGLSCSRLQHLFKTDTELCIRTFVKARRLDRAAELIVATDQRVSEIFYSVGFGDAANFNHAFKRRFGLSPREYRARDQEIRERGRKEDSVPVRASSAPRSAILGSTQDSVRESG